MVLQTLTSLTTSQKVGILICIVLVIFALSGILCCLHRRKKHMKKAQKYAYAGPQTTEIEGGMHRWHSTSDYSDGVYVTGEPVVPHDFVGGGRRQRGLG